MSNVKFFILDKQTQLKQKMGIANNTEQSDVESFLEDLYREARNKKKASKKHKEKFKQKLLKIQVTQLKVFENFEKETPGRF